LADKSTRLIRDALGRAAAAPDGLALLGSKSEPGLFPPTALARAAADRCKDEGLLSVVRTEARGKQVREICALTEKGRHYLVRQSSPREVIEDFVRVLENRQTEAEALADAVAKMRQSLEGIRAAVEMVLPRLAGPHPALNGSTHMNGLAAPPPTASTAGEALIAEVKSRLAEWHAAAGASEDCPLPELYRRLESAGRTSIGQFHDGLRQLHDDQTIYLHPWTGPLYALPEPAFALLVGHEIAYYASIR
jgi:HAMP domain-containing protein